MNQSREREIPESLAWRALVGLKKHPYKTVVIDCSGPKPKKMRAVKLLAIAAELAAKIRQLPEERIGIVLPPGIGGTIANLAIAFAGKSSVNLNFTASPPVIRNTLYTSGVKTIITAGPMKQKFTSFPWTNDIWDLTELLKAPGIKTKIIKKMAATFMLSVPRLAKKWEIERYSNNEATLLFSSGSTGMPKGVPLTHGNIGANVDQIQDIQLLPSSTRLLACMPIFHSFGLTVTLWYPLCHPLRVITYPSPTEVTPLGKVIKQQKASVMIGSASLYRLYMKQIPSHQLRSLKYVIAGAEKTPKGLHEQWQKTCGSLYLEGYGLTETSPVVCVNTPHDNVVGTVGLPLKGMEARIVDVSTREVLPLLGAKGVLELKGPNVFLGYLNDPALNREIFHDGWFWTGDLGSITTEGRLVIEGRLRRFSKIGGEMVPHGAVEEAIVEVYGWGELSKLPAAVTGVTDEKKGESLVLVSQEKIDVAELGKRLRGKGVPNLWIPKKVVVVDALPYLPSGKLDLQKLGEMAKS